MKKTNKQKFEELDKDKKIEYIWDYYKGHIFGGIFGIAAIAYIIYFVNRPAPPVYSADAVVAGIIQVVDHKELEASQLAMQEAVDGGIRPMPTDWESMDQTAAINNQLMLVKIQTKECDVMIVPEFKHKGYLTAEDYELFHKLDEIPELEEVLELYSDQLVVGTTPLDDEEHVYGIRVNELQNVDGLLIGEELVMSLLNPPKDMEAGIALMKYLLIEE